MRTSSLLARGAPMDDVGFDTWEYYVGSWRIDRHLPLTSVNGTFPGSGLPSKELFAVDRWRY